jgi:hypothetical protein
MRKLNWTTLLLVGLAAGSLQAGSAMAGDTSKHLAQQQQQQPKAPKTETTGTTGTGATGTGTGAMGTAPTTTGTGTGSGATGPATGAGTTTTSGAGSPTQVMAEKVTVTATVEDIDKDDRKLSLKKADGEEVDVVVPSDVGGFEKIKKGDKVDASYYVSAAVGLIPGGAKTPTVEERQTGTRELGGGLVTREVVATLPVVSVDLAKESVVLRTPNGNTRTVKVKDPTVKRRLPQLKAGDTVQITFTEAVATTVTPHKKQ